MSDKMKRKHIAPCSYRFSDDEVLRMWHCLRPDARTKMEDILEIQYKYRYDGNFAIIK